MIAVVADISSFSHLTFFASRHFGSGEESVSQQTPSPDGRIRMVVIGT
jgi:hypothetical protein